MQLLQVIAVELTPHRKAVYNIRSCSIGDAFCIDLIGIFIHGSVLCMLGEIDRSRDSAAVISLSIYDWVRGVASTVAVSNTTSDFMVGMEFNVV